MPIRSASECLAPTRGYVDASNVCAGYPTGTDSPRPDHVRATAGDPCSVATPDSRTQIQVGTVSYGPDSGCVELDRPIV